MAQNEVILSGFAICTITGTAERFRQILQFISKLNFGTFQVACSSKCIEFELNDPTAIIKKYVGRVNHGTSININCALKCTRYFSYESFKQLKGMIDVSQMIKLQFVAADVQPLNQEVVDGLAQIGLSAYQ